ncbi:uncharacterized protein LOC112464350 [Temnothorax curvispinosus]|uniref:Uncharacterized protein LOC112464350 n=1 Tax=Temnothorax curvispinosus TaxID=300111 RepID=A0A6J1QXK5_9HYME|nr:uncharacterized protein LOC112464350 [Temnothorax curvispinosus]
MPCKPAVPPELAIQTIKNFMQYCDPLPAWSHKAWKDMSTALGNKWSYQTWVNVYYDRNSILSIARNEMGIVVPPKLDQNNNSELDTFDLVLTEQQWNEMKSDIILSKIKASSGRSKLKLKPGVWTIEISISFWQQFRLPCAFVFKRAEVYLSPDDTTYTIKIIGSCKSKVCGNTF